MITMTHIRAQFDEFRTLCLSLYPDDFEILLQEGFKNEFGEVEPPLGLYAAILTDLPEKPIKTVCYLVKTPRVLKTIFRHTLSAWERLHGEIDFDDLLIAYVLRFSTPEAFDFILSNCNALRDLHGLKAEERPDKQKIIDDQWSSLCVKVQWNHASAKRLIQFLFYGWTTQNTQGRKMASRQGFQISEPTDYWSRFVTGELGENELRDQKVFLSIRNWHRDQKSGQEAQASLLASLLTDSVFSGKFKQLAELICESRDYRDLATLLFAEILKQSGASACGESSPGFFSLWQLAIQNPIAEQAHLKWVEEQIILSLPISLRFSNDLYYYWSCNTERDIKYKERRSSVRSAVISHARTIYAQSPESFIKALDPNIISSSSAFAIHFSAEDQGGPGFDAADWGWFASLLLNAAEINAEVITPQIVAIVSTHFAAPNAHDGFALQLDQPFIDSLFGDDLERLMKILSADIPTTQLSETDKASVQYVKDQATEWIAKHSSATQGESDVLRKT